MKNLVLSFLLLQFIWFFNFGLSDAPKSWQLGFQDPATPIMEGIVDFHNHLMIFVVAIAIFVIWLLVRCLQLYKSYPYFVWSKTTLLQLLENWYKFLKNQEIDSSLFKKYHQKVLSFNTEQFDEKFTHATLLEIVWTIFPAFILMVIAVPSFALLYAMEELVVPSLTLKIVGHQWYWSYEYPEVPVFSEHPTELKETFEDENSSLCLDYQDFFLCFKGKHMVYNFDSYMAAADDLTSGTLRLLEVDKRVVLPEKTHIRLLVTAADVLHSWTIPSFGVKVDACPGRLNQASLFVKRCGMFFGQCSEICGVNHGFMPIAIKVVTTFDFFSLMRAFTFSKN